MTSLGKSALIPAEYLPLHKYLDGRYADTVVLTFSEVEDLIGITLPAVAHTEAAWWDNGDGGSGASPQSHSWTRANRTAKPNMPAKIVVFDRTSV
jgi:hypothetical protein